MRATMQEPTVLPTPERVMRGGGAVVRKDHTIIDELGTIAQPFEALDVLRRMLLRRTISDVMLQAGEQFRKDFTIGALESLHAADMARVTSRGGSSTVGVSALDARARVWEAVVALGGLTSPAGCCVWHVLGLEETLQEWAVLEGWRGRPVKPHVASGILVSALGVLVAHYGLDSNGRQI